MGATLLTSTACGQPEEPLPIASTQTLEQKVEAPKSIPNFKNYDAEVYHQHDQTILTYVDQLNTHFKGLSSCEGLDPIVAKSWILQETGSPNHRNAFTHDPTQMANNGDYGLSELQDPKFFWKLGLEDMSEEFSEFDHTHWKNGKLDYSGNNSMTSEASIKGGLIFLFGKHFEDYHTKTVPDGEPFYHTVESGDTLGAIAQDNGSYLAFIEGLNPDISPDKLKIGDKIKVQSAHKVSQPSNCRSWANTLDRYNGGGTEGYSQDILTREKLQESQKSSPN